MDAEVDVAAIKDGAADRFTLSSAPDTPWAPSGPPRLGILAVSILLSVVLVLAAVVLAELGDPSVRGVRDIRDMIGGSLLAVVPEIENSVLRARRVHRITVLASSVLVGTTILYFIVHSLTA
jgi:hypothetical protein